MRAIPLKVSAAMRGVGPWQARACFGTANSPLSAAAFTKPTVRVVSSTVRAAAVKPAVPPKTRFVRKPAGPGTAANQAAAGAVDPASSQTQAASLEDDLPPAPEFDETATRTVPSMARGMSNEAPILDDSMVASLASMESADPDAREVYDDWGSSFQGLGSAPFSDKVSDILLADVEPTDIEVTPDGLIYLPEIKYRRILNRAFGPGGWGIAPRTKTMVTKRQVTREYGLVCLGRLVSVSRGEMDYFSPEGVTTAMEGCKSNALMRCCKDLGIASELWDPSFIRSFKARYCDSKYYEKKRRFVWKRKDRQWEYPYV